MDKTKVMAKFSILGDEFEPDKITEILAIQPSTTWKKGEPIPNRVHRRIETSWSIDTGYEESYDTNDQVEKLCEVLKGKAEVLKQLKNDLGVKLLFGIVVTIENEETPAMGLSRDFTKLLHDMGAEVYIDLYKYS